MPTTAAGWDAWNGWVGALWDVLQTDDEACLGLIRSAGGRGGIVALIEGEATTGEALAYARTLCELGFAAEAWEIFQSAVASAFESATFGWLAAA